MQIAVGLRRKSGLHPSIIETLVEVLVDNVSDEIAGCVDFAVHSETV